MNIPSVQTFGKFCCSRCYGVVVVASGSSPSAYIRGLIHRIDRGDPNVLPPPPPKLGDGDASNKTGLIFEERDLRKTMRKIEVFYKVTSECKRGEKII